MVSRSLQTFLKVIPLAVILSIWEVAGRLSPSARFFYGVPTTIAAAFVSDVLSGVLLTDAAITFSAALLGLVIGVTTGFGCAIILSLSPLVSAVAQPYIAFLGSIPIVAISPLVILWFGTGYKVSVATAAMSTAILVAAQIFDGLQQSLYAWSRLARSFRASRTRLYVHLVIPGAAAWLFSSWRAAIGLALIGAFIGEFISADRGVGRYVLRFASLYDAPRVWAGLFLIGIVAVSLTALMQRIERSVFPWRGTLTDTRVLDL